MRQLGDFVTLGAHLRSPFRMTISYTFLELTDKAHGVATRLGNYSVECCRLNQARNTIRLGILGRLDIHCCFYEFFKLV